MTNRTYTREQMMNLHEEGYSLWVNEGRLHQVNPEEVNITAEPPYTKTPADLINGIIGDRQDIRYLEIGVHEGETFDLINAMTKHGVDPYGGSPNITHKMSSQMFFAMNNYFYRETYDIIFIDGCHMAKIIEQEVIEASQILRPGGVIILHDTVPLREVSQLVLHEEYESFLGNLPGQEEYKSFREYSLDNPWLGYNGDSWRVVHRLRNRPKSDKIFVGTAADACCTVVAIEPSAHGFDPPPPTQKVDWDYYYNHCADILLPMEFEVIVKAFNDRLNEYKDTSAP